MTSRTVQTAFRLPVEVLEAMDVKVEELTQRLCFRVHRTHIVEAALRKYLNLPPAAVLEDIEPKLDVLNTSVSEFLSPCSTRLRNCLGAGQHAYDMYWLPKWGPKPVYVGQLVQVRPRQLLKIENFGAHTLGELEAHLGVYGLSFGMDIGDWTSPEESSS